MVLAGLLELGALYLAPTDLGPHVALVLFAAAYAWEWRSVYWRYAVPVLLAYVLGVMRLFGAGTELFPHALAGLVACVLVRFLPGRRAPEAAAEPENALGGLGLLDPPHGEGPES
jgi:hypothetical protein